MPGFADYLRGLGIRPEDQAFDEGDSGNAFPEETQDAYISSPYSGASDPYVQNWTQNGGMGRAREESVRGQATQQAGTAAAGGQVYAPGIPLPQGPAADAITAHIRAAAAKRGIDPDIALQIADREGGRDKYEGNMGQFKTGRSHWAYQLHYGGAGTPYASWGNTVGMGNDFTERTGFRPGDPAAWQAAIDFALDKAVNSGWEPWYGRNANPARGLREIGVWEGIPRR